MLAEPSARDGVRAIEAAALAKAATIRRAAEAKATELKELKSKSAGRENAVKKLKTAPPKEVHIIVKPVRKTPVPIDLMPVEALNEAVSRSDAEIKKIRQTLAGKPKSEHIVESKLIRR